MEHIFCHRSGEIRQKLAGMAQIGLSCNFFVGGGGLAEARVADPDPDYFLKAGSGCALKSNGAMEAVDALQN